MLIRNALLPIVAVTAIVVLAQPADVAAAVYKCVDDEGTITFSQAPCPDNPEKVNVQGVSTGSAKDGVDCRYANRFALDTAKTMRTGMESVDLFDSYGGLDSLSKGTINLINFVYRYKANSTVSSERIAGMAQSMCQTGNIAEVSCNHLPVSFTEGLGGCGENTDFAVGDDPQMTSSAPAPAPSNQAAAPAQYTSPTDPRSAECRREYLQRIEALDAQMRGGYSSEQGERFREQRRQLRQQMSRC